MKLPPPEKIYEAWSALAGGRLASESNPDSPEGSAAIRSSSGLKEYEVRWADNIYFASDPATWWQGYPGYPILAVLMYRGILPFNPEIARPFASVPWEKINKKFARNYSLALEEVLKNLNLSNEEKNEAQIFAEKSFQKLASLNIETRRLVKSRNAGKKN